LNRCSDYLESAALLAKESDIIIKNFSTGVFYKTDNHSSVPCTEEMMPAQKCASFLTYPFVVSATREPNGLKIGGEVTLKSNS
jgi:hypothetical protein